MSVDDARRLEAAFLAGLNDAQDAYEQIVTTEAWADLGFDTFAGWWEERVRPAMRALSMRPTREIAAAVVEQVRREEAGLPSAQRRTQRELADMVGMDRRTASGWRPPSQDRPGVQDVRGADLEPPVDPLPESIAQEIDRRIEEKTAQRETPPAWDPVERRAHGEEVRRRQDIEAARHTTATILTSLRSQVATVITGCRWGERLVTKQLVADLRGAIDLLEGEIHE